MIQGFSKAGRGKPDGLFHSRSSKEGLYISFFVLGLYLFGSLFLDALTVFWIENKPSSRAILYPRSAPVS